MYEYLGVVADIGFKPIDNGINRWLTSMRRGSAPCIKEGNMNILIKSLVAIVLVAILIPSGCLETEYEPGEGGVPPVTEKLQILNHTGGFTDYGSPMVTGTAKNVSSSNLIYAEIRVKWYDSAGVLLDTSLDNINDLGAGETWRFEVIYFGDEKGISYEIGIGSTF